MDLTNIQPYVSDEEPITPEQKAAYHAVPWEERKKRMHEIVDEMNKLEAENNPKPMCNHPRKWEIQEVDKVILRDQWGKVIIDPKTGDFGEPNPEVEKYLDEYWEPLSITHVVSFRRLEPCEICKEV